MLHSTRKTYSIRTHTQKTEIRINTDNWNRLLCKRCINFIFDVFQIWAIMWISASSLLRTVHRIESRSNTFTMFVVTNKKNCVLTMLSWGFVRIRASLSCLFLSSRFVFKTIDIQCVRKMCNTWWYAQS